MAKRTIVAQGSCRCSCGALVEAGVEIAFSGGVIEGCPSCFFGEAPRALSQRPLQQCLQLAGERLANLDLEELRTSDILATAERLSLISALLTRFALARARSSAPKLELVRSQS